MVWLYIAIVMFNIIRLGQSNVDVVRVASAAYEALGPDLHQIKQQIEVLQKGIIAEIEKHITETMETAASKYFELFSRLGLTPIFPASSCKEILQLYPQSPSGLYWIRGNELQQMYCDMERSCKGVAGGWMRVASINMTDNKSTCPSGLRTLTSPRRLCATNTDIPGCSSVILQAHGVNYSQVCGKIIGYQQGSPDAFNTGQNTLETNYVDGISITHGQSPRKHIWTFAAALHEYHSSPNDVCPCTNTRNTPPPPSIPTFVGNDYFCDTGSENSNQQFIFYGADPLWDGAGCSEYSTCCEWNSPPWFRKEISPSTNDDIEMRLCANESEDNEDINFEMLEIYVQ